MDFTSKSCWFQELLQKHMHLSDAMLKQPLSEKIRRAAEYANVEIDIGIKAFSLSLGCEKGLWKVLTHTHQNIFPT